MFAAAEVFGRIVADLAVGSSLLCYVALAKVLGLAEVQADPVALVLPAVERFTVQATHSGRERVTEAVAET